jgi:hypothetical protein
MRECLRESTAKKRARTGAHRMIVDVSFVWQEIQVRCHFLHANAVFRVALYAPSVSERYKSAVLRIRRRLRMN